MSTPPCKSHLIQNISHEKNLDKKKPGEEKHSSTIQSHANSRNSHVRKRLNCSLGQVKQVTVTAPLTVCFKPSVQKCASAGSEPSERQTAISYNLQVKGSQQFLIQGPPSFSGEKKKNKEELSCTLVLHLSHLQPYKH